MSTATQASGRTPGDGRPGRYVVGFAGIWLVFLGPAYREAWQRLPEPSGWVGMVTLTAFSAAYLLAFAWIRQRRQRLLPDVPAPAAAAVLLGLLWLGLGATLAVGQEGTSTAVYVAVLGIFSLPIRWAVALDAVLIISTEVAARTVSGWTTDQALALAICASSIAVWGIQQLLLRNLELARARDENARLAVVQERSRFARDLHDILGHSLTVITVKAELAGRLLDLDPERARTELADLERLSRDALADVRRAVEGYRELTLPGELARARAALAAADIEADVPGSTDEVPTRLRELFAWAVREGVTNVLRHSRARHCRIELTPTCVAVVDDGPGPQTPDPEGNGLQGLRERAREQGAELRTERLRPGFRLEVAAP